MRALEATDHGMTAKAICNTTLRQQNTVSILAARMEAAGLATNVRQKGERESKLLITPRGRSLLEAVPTESLKSAYSVLDHGEKLRFIRYMRSLHERARSLLAPEGSEFLKQIARRATVTSLLDNEADDRPSDYVIWSHMDSARFAISRLRELELAEYGLTVAQASMLRVLAHAGRAATSRDLEDVTLRKHNSVSALVERMIRMGLVAREKALGERAYRVSLTETGGSILSGLPSVALEMTFSAINETEKRELSGYLLSLYLKARGELGYTGNPPIRRNGGNLSISDSFAGRTVGIHHQPRETVGNKEVI